MQQSFNSLKDLDIAERVLKWDMIRVNKKKRKKKSFKKKNNNKKKSGNTLAVTV